MKNVYETISIPTPMSDIWGQEFANNWLVAWNSKDIEKIIEFYSDEIVLVSPAVKNVTGYQDGVIIKKSEIKDMWLKVFQQIPELQYSLVAVAVGIDSLTIHYTSSLCDMVADVLKFDRDWKIIKSCTYY